MNINVNENGINNNVGMTDNIETSILHNQQQQQPLLVE